MSKRKNIQTVRGSISSEEFAGITLMHEHLHIRMDFIPLYLPDENSKCVSFELKHLGWIRQNPYSYKENLNLSQSIDDVMIAELGYYLKAGGKNIVEVSTEGIHPNPKYLQGIAAKVPELNIVAGTGYYVDKSQSDSVKSLTTEVMCNKLHNDITDGFEGTEIKAGIIGEIGCQWPLTDFERRSLRAAASAQAATGCPITIHPGRHIDAPEEIVRILREAGCDMDKLVMGHLDRTIQDEAALLEFAKHGCYCEWDLFGLETSNYQLAPHLDMPSDAQRIRWLKGLLDSGYEDKVLLSHDIFSRHRLVSFGGHGYAHIINNVIDMMKVRGVSETQINKMLKDNPATLLAFQ